MTEFDGNGKIIFNFNTLKYTKASYFEILGEKYIKITTSSPWLLENLGKYISLHERLKFWNSLLAGEELYLNQ